jgi:hypothetical protein
MKLEQIFEGKSFEATVSDETFRVYVNPHKTLIKKLLNGGTRYNNVRAMANENEIYVWDAYYAAHEEMENIVGRTFDWYYFIDTKYTSTISMEPYLNGTDDDFIEGMEYPTFVRSFEDITEYASIPAGVKMFLDRYYKKAVGESLLKEAAVINTETLWGQPIRIFKNPIEKVVRRLFNDPKKHRGVRAGLDGDVLYVWSGYEGTHGDVETILGIEYFDVYYAIGDGNDSATYIVPYKGLATVDAFWEGMTEPLFMRSFGDIRKYASIPKRFNDVIQNRLIESVVSEAKKVHAFSGEFTNISDVSDFLQQGTDKRVVDARDGGSIHFLNDKNTELAYMNYIDRFNRNQGYEFVLVDEAKQRKITLIKTVNNLLVFARKLPKLLKRAEDILDLIEEFSDNIEELLSREFPRVEVDYESDDGQINIDVYPELDSANFNTIIIFYDIDKDLTLFNLNVVGGSWHPIPSDPLGTFNYLEDIVDAIKEYVREDQ